MKSFTIIPALMLMMATAAYSGNDDSYHRQIADLTRQISQNPDNAALYILRGDVYDLLDDFSNSNKDFKKVLTLYKKNRDRQFLNDFAKASYHLADDYFFRLSDRTNAMHYVKEGLKEIPSYKDLEILEAIILAADLQQHMAALEKYKAVSEKYADDARLSFYYGKFLKDTDQLAAAAQFEKVISADPSNLEVLVLLGTIYNNEGWKLSTEGNYSASLTDYMQKSYGYFEKAYALNPNDTELQSILYGEPEQPEKKKEVSSGPY